MELHSSFETAHARCFCGPVSFDVWGWDVTPKKKLCGKFSMCWYVSWNNGCFDMTGAETLILASFMCHSLKWKKKNDEIAVHVKAQKKHTPDALLFWRRPAFLWHCKCWWNIGLYRLILKPTPQCIHQRCKSIACLRGSAARLCSSLFVKSMLKHQDISLG